MPIELERRTRPSNVGALPSDSAAPARPAKEVLPEQLGLRVRVDLGEAVRMLESAAESQQLRRQQTLAGGHPSDARRPGHIGEVISG